MAADLITVDAITGAINVASGLAAGSYTVYVEGMLQIGLKASYKFTLVNNSLPIFNSPLVDQTMKEGAILTYTLPTYSDPDGQTITLSVVRGSIFLTFSPTSITFTNPIIPGHYLIIVSLSDGLDQPEYFFDLNVTPLPFFSPELAS